VIEAEKAAPEIARQAMERVGALYGVEKQAAGLSAVERLKLRQEKSAPMLLELREKLLVWKEQLLPKHPMAEAIGYALSQWQELNVFCSDGAAAIDNNASEREMKRVVLNRKNSLFVGNPRGGRTAAILASLTSTCRRHEIDPQLYFTQLLFNLPTTQPSQLSAWLPDQWKLNQSASTTPAYPQPCGLDSAHYGVQRCWVYRIDYCGWQHECWVYPQQGFYAIDGCSAFERRSSSDAVASSVLFRLIGAKQV
jgi:Transposase IS66 family